MQLEINRYTFADLVIVSIQRMQVVALPRKLVRAVGLRGGLVARDCDLIVYNNYRTC